MFIVIKIQIQFKRNVSIFPETENENKKQNRKE
jgi:hypothetical protein